MMAVVVEATHHDGNDHIELRRSGSKWSVSWWEPPGREGWKQQIKKFWTDKEGARAFYNQKIRDIAIRRATKALGLSTHDPLDRV